MNIRIDHLVSLDELQRCTELQAAIGEDSERRVLPAYMLVTINRSGGIVLGAYDEDCTQRKLCGCLVDLADWQGDRTAWRTVFHGVSSEARNSGIGYMLRRRELEECRRNGMDLVTWAIDPLLSAQSHFAFNKLGTVSAHYERNLFGELDDPANQGLASDRLIVEWWLDSPRVVSVVEEGELPHHFRLGFERMEVATRTRLAKSGIRKLVGAEMKGDKEVVLVEIPVDLEGLICVDPACARDWRIGLRDVFESAFAKGYILTGFVHEGGRSFQLLERVAKEGVLERVF